MKQRLTLIILLVLSSAPANAEWMKISDKDKGALYIDTTTIRRNGNLVRMWELYDFKTVQASRNPFFSVKAVREYDCTMEQTRFIGTYAYASQMGAGEVVDSDRTDEIKWEPVMPGSADEILWKIACGKK